MKPINLLFYITYLSTIYLNASDNMESEFIKTAASVAPEHYHLYVAAKIGSEEFLAIYKPTDEEPHIKEEKKKRDAYDAWYERYNARKWKDDPSDPKPEDGKLLYYELFKAKIGSHDKLKEVPVNLGQHHGGEEEIRFLDKVLYLPGINYPMFLPANPQDGPTLFRCKWESMSQHEKDTLQKLHGWKRFQALYEKLALTMLYIAKNE